MGMVTQHMTRSRWLPPVTAALMMGKRGPTMHKIFVYGTLLSGHGNHRLLEGRGTMIGTAISEAKFTMLHLGGFPGIVQKGETAILGEVYEVDHETLRDLDGLEGHPHFYKRTPITVEMRDAKVPVEAYVLPDSWLSRSNTSVIESGNWRERNNVRH